MLELPLAGPTSRILAYVIDVACLGAILAALLLLAVNPLMTVQTALQGVGERLLADLSDPERAIDAIRELIVVGMSVLLLLQVAAETAYFALFETLAGGRSPGKMIVGLRVVTDGGRAIGFPQALARNLLRFIDALPMSYLVGLISLLLSGRNQRLGDIAAGTIVVRLDRPPSAASVDDAPQPGDEAFVFDHEQSRRIGAAEVRLARETLRRLRTIRGEERAELLAISVRALCARLGRAPVDAPQRAAFLRAVLRAARQRRGV